jgi:hypothetical protein
MEDSSMFIRTTTDPMTLRDVTDPDHHPHVLEGDRNNGLDIAFESEENRQAYLDMHPLDPKIVQGTDTDDYVAEG